MNVSVNDYAFRPRHPSWEKELAALLRGLREWDRLAFLMGLLPHQTAVALDLARRCLTERGSYEAILDRALDETDASTIRDWLECVVPRLGFRRVIQRLKLRRETDRAAVGYARYWLPSFSNLPGYDYAELEALGTD